MFSKCFCWDMQSLKAKKHSWVINVAKDYPFVGKVFEAIEKDLKKKGETWRDHRNYALPAKFVPLAKRIEDQILRGTGVVLLENDLQISHNSARMLLLTLGCHFGSNISRTAQRDNRPLFTIQMAVDPTANKLYQGNGLNCKAIGFHTDGSGTREKVGLLGLLCLRPAQEMGQTRISSAQMAFRTLAPKYTKWLLQPLPRTHPYLPDLAPTELVRRPVFRGQAETNFYREFSYHPDRVRHGIKKTHQIVSSKQEEALGALDTALEEFSFDIMLKPNEILLINNRVVAHGRREFKDDPKEPRTLERFWGELGN